MAGALKEQGAAASGDVQSPDEWKPGLYYCGRAGNTKKVRRAGDCPLDVPLVILRHNLRLDNQGHRHRSFIDPDRTRLNSILRGPAHPSIGHEIALSILDELGLTPKRRDQIITIELVIQPPDGLDELWFWESAIEFIESRYQHIISAVVHRDQKRPHMHVVCLAVQHGEWAGNELSSGINKFTRQRIYFLDWMRTRHGLRVAHKISAKMPGADPLATLAEKAGAGDRRRDGMGVDGMGVAPHRLLPVVPLMQYQSEPVNETTMNHTEKMNPHNCVASEPRSLPSRAPRSQPDAMASARSAVRAARANGAQRIRIRRTPARLTNSASSVLQRLMQRLPSNEGSIKMIEKKSDVQNPLGFERSLTREGKGGGMGRFNTLLTREICSGHAEYQRAA